MTRFRNILITDFFLYINNSKMNMYFSSVVFYHPSLQNRSEYLLYKLIHYSHGFKKKCIICPRNTEHDPACKEAHDKYDFGEGNMKSVLVSSQFSEGGIQFVTDSLISLLLCKQFICKERKDQLVLHILRVYQTLSSF